MKKRFFSIALILFLTIVICAWMIFGPATAFREKNKFIFVREGRNVKEQVMQQLDSENIVLFKSVFNIVATRAKVWQRLKPGRFEIKKGESIFNIVRTLRNNTQSPVRLIINKLRTKEDFARQIGRNFSTDSTTAINFFNSNDSLESLGVDTNTLYTIIIPDTYLYYWNTSLRTILNRLKTESEKFWNENNRFQRASDKGLMQSQVYIIASIVEEETNRNDEKGNIASVYINRLNRGMPLAADPTIKYLLRNFNIKRIFYEYLRVESPYNTYRNRGLPPGPVCTPSQRTIDAVLNAPPTDYLFFVAKSDFSGYHHFSNNFAEHQQYAKEYQKALNAQIAKKQKS